MIIVNSESAGAIERAAEIIRNGGMVAFPTETVYGLGADALNPSAVARIFEAKKRPSFDPLIVHLCSKEQIGEFCLRVNKTAERLIDRFFPGPLTLVLPKRRVIPDIVTAGLDTVAVRIPAHETALRLIEESGRPVAAPSANPFGYLSPTDAGDVARLLGGSIDMLLDGGKTMVGVESTVVFFEGKTPVVARHGGVTIEELRTEIGEVKVIGNSAIRPVSPGLLKRHYSPKTPIIIVRDFRGISRGKSASPGFLAFREPPEHEGGRAIEILSKTGDLKEAAVNFFSALHRLDASGVDVIYAERIPEKGLGRAIMERLRKAACR
ncbi:MAG: threonylcarbamoyl-AMP synthase [Deltaproteobacteria bacterium]|nr:threonylcarbamoyl-AMP synthase [Deltaproteobacteria bacterium]